MTNLPLNGVFSVTKRYRVAGSWAAGFHTGIDLYSSNRNIYGVCNGTVKYTGWDDAYGNYIKITDSITGKVFLYAHLKRIDVSIGQTISRTTCIGEMGNTGRVFATNGGDGTHLHIEMRTSADKYGAVEDIAAYMGIPNVEGTYNSANYQITPPAPIPNMMYAAHCQNLGWQEEKRNGDWAGLLGQGLRVEALIINADINIQYRVHMAGKGWSDWVPNGCMAGTIGESRAIEAIEIQSSKNIIVGQAYVENIGYQNEVRGTQITIGTTGQALRIEGFRLKFE